VKPSTLQSLWLPCGNIHSCTLQPHALHLCRPDAIMGCTQVRAGCAAHAAWGAHLCAAHALRGLQLAKVIDNAVPDALCDGRPALSAHLQRVNKLFRLYCSHEAMGAGRQTSSTDIGSNVHRTLVNVTHML
jgi:hypothetical protein